MVYSLSAKDVKKNIDGDGGNVVMKKEKNREGGG
jgi:hypothetical protein